MRHAIRDEAAIPHGTMDPSSYFEAPELLIDLGQFRSANILQSRDDGTKGHSMEVSEMSSR